MKALIKFVFAFAAFADFVAARIFEYFLAHKCWVKSQRFSKPILINYSLSTKK